MTTNLDASFMAAMYALAGVVFSAFAVYLRMGWTGGRLGGALLGAIVLSAGWSFAYSSGIYLRSPILLTVAAVLDLVRLATWALFLYGLLGVADARAVRAGRFHLMNLCGACVILAVTMYSIPGWLQHLPDRWRIFAFLALAVWLLVLVDQVYFNFPPGSRWGIKPLALGLAAAFCFDLYLYADGYLFGRLDWNVASIRGVIHALVMPLVGMSAVRSRNWHFRITVSREVAFHSAALVGAGGYLLLVASAGYYIRWFGGSWGTALQTALLFCGFLVLAIVAFSGSVRARLRVVLTKHFFSYRYDYRQAWINLTRSLATRQEGWSLEQAAIGALADLVESPGGVLFFRKGLDGSLEVGGQLNCADHAFSTANAKDLCEFLETQEWIVILDEWTKSSTIAPPLVIPEWLSSVPNAWLIVPLIVADRLIGCVMLFAPRAPVDVDWEVRDLLKMAGRQAASYLAQSKATEALLEAEKFDSFNRMSAFVVHDLKNIVAQLSLMVKNAQRHRGNPEFEADMLMTVENSTERMRNLMAQLQNKKPIEPQRLVDLAEVCRAVVGAKKGADRLLTISADAGLNVRAHAERLERIIGHLVQNAVEATPVDGKVEVSVKRQSNLAQLEVRDSGAGMTAEFIRSRLFRPFQTTKATGMGIGAYEVQQYVGELGGQVEVESEPGKGTRFLISLPLSSSVHGEVAHA